MKPYRLKHVPTGLYLDYRSKCHVMNKIGKVYISGINELNYDKFYECVFCWTPDGYKKFMKTDFVKEEVDL